MALISGIGSSDVGRRLHRDPLLLDGRRDARRHRRRRPRMSRHRRPIDVSGCDRIDARYHGRRHRRRPDHARAHPALAHRWRRAGRAAGLDRQRRPRRGRRAGDSRALLPQRLGVDGPDRGRAAAPRSWPDPSDERPGGASPTASATPPTARLAMQRYMHESGATREQFAQLAVVSRANAAGNPLAVYRDPMTVDDYLGARMISDPLCMYDCDVPVDGAMAVVVSRADSSAIDRRRTVGIEAVGTASGFEASADMLWSRTDLKPSDVDMAQMYDGFTMLRRPVAGGARPDAPERDRALHRRWTAHLARRRAAHLHRRRSTFRRPPPRLRRPARGLHPAARGGRRSPGAGSTRGRCGQQRRRIVHVLPAAHPIGDCHAACRHTADVGRRPHDRAPTPVGRASPGAVPRPMPPHRRGRRPGGVALRGRADLHPDGLVPRPSRLRRGRLPARSGYGPLR